jgi:hypothetical protein
MYKNYVIRNFTAGAMFLLFAISITPKQIFHDIITRHKHSYIKFDGTINVQASKNNFQCNWHDQPVKSPFTDQPAFRLVQPIIVYNSYINRYSFRFYSTELFFSSLRGPPAQA